MIELLHNERCSKSQCALSLLEDKSAPFKVRNYLENPLSMQELEALTALLGVSAEALVRKTEPLFTRHYLGKKFSEKDWITLLATHPELLQRPIAISGNRAVIARPPEKITELF